MVNVSIARDFSVTPGGRFNRDGPYSGEAFRQRFLEPAIDAGEMVVVDLDRVAGLPSSFLEEAFGGLFRRENLPAATILARVKVQTHESALLPYVALVKRYMSEAAERAAAR
ncbi:STAS-like domain-containing protein [Phenylobacterium sp.]|jgi:hypothetical protein|uniref:STAS-like domain-containing protein n=1 Tax=Phenylobacterium sp. TaxID=1871053 RepID=UPI002E2FF76C|nr:STAS-like domain-containing protein [Phenylobacterium sp.]HEX3367618.1 STAS-like domain-containing protein [Phenylobacterium sp.]